MKYLVSSWQAIKNFMLKERSSEFISSLGNSIASISTIVATIIFFIDFARSSSTDIPFLGIALTVGSFASFIVEAMIGFEKMNNGSKLGTWVAFLLSVFSIGAFILGLLFLAGGGN